MLQKTSKHDGDSMNSNHGNGHINTKISIFSEELRRLAIESHTIGERDGVRYTFMNATWRCFPAEATSMCC